MPEPRIDTDAVRVHQTLSVKSRRYVVGLVNGEVLIQGGRDSARECCESCGAAPHRNWPCRGYGSRGEPSEGHRGDEV
jgi:hypothetical protein